jgi:hypothetical protein
MNRKYMSTDPHQDRSGVSPEGSRGFPEWSHHSSEKPAFTSKSLAGCAYFKANAGFPRINDSWKNIFSDADSLA